jgi:hypothetical protein
MTKGIETVSGPDQAMCRGRAELCHCSELRLITLAPELLFETSDSLSPGENKTFEKTSKKNLHQKMQL